MEFKFFDISGIFKTKDEFEGSGECLVTYDYSGFSLRWIQPPLATYFISTLDEDGNHNLAPISLGTAVWGEHPHGRWFYTIGVQKSRQTNRNLKLNKECVISYLNKSLIRASTIASFPVPYGISEMEICNLTPLPSRKVKPAGIQESYSNLEAKIVDEVEVANTTIFIAEIAGVSVNKECLEKDKEMKYEPGIGGTDLIYEMSITGNPPRLNYAMMDTAHIIPSPSDIGDGKAWKGTFESWMKSELERGRIDGKECDRLLELNTLWLQDTNPDTNEAVKDELTKRLRAMYMR